MIDQLEALIQQHALIPTGARLLIGVSGGLDSIVLLHALAQLAPKHQWHLQIAHLNHKLRGRSSDADQRLVTQTAQKLRLPCHTAQADIRALAKKQKISLEMAGRDARFEFFGKIARQQNIPLLALAHHADDQIELFFLRLLRGAGPEGLAGMKLTRQSVANGDVKIIHPLLHVTKQELRAYARTHQIRFRHDATNQSLRIPRNRIRHQLIPLLRKHYQPALHQVIPRLQQILRDENELLTQLTQHGLKHLPQFGTWNLEPGPFDTLPPALQRRVLRHQIYSLGLPADFHLIESLRTYPQTPVVVRPELALCRDLAGRIHQTSVRPASPHAAANLPLPLKTRGHTQFAGVRLSWQISPLPRRRPPANSRIGGVECFDADTILAASHRPAPAPAPTITLRHWQPGDRYQPTGMNAPVKLQDLFANHKIPRAQRHRLVIATTATGDIFWVQGLRISQNHKITPATRRILRWTWKPLPGNPERPSSSAVQSR